MKVASDVLLLLCLHDFGLWVSVGLGQATAFLYSEARLYKGPRQSPLLSWRPHVLQATSPCGQRVNHSNTRGLVSSLFFSRSRKSLLHLVYIFNIFYED